METLETLARPYAHVTKTVDEGCCLLLLLHPCLDGHHALKPIP